MNAKKVLSIALVLSKSQLRASRSGRGGQSVFRNTAILGVIDVTCFSVFAAIGFFVASFVEDMPDPLHSQVLTALRQGMVFVPALVPSVVLVAGILFELSTSSKFASSDSVNWLPVKQSEYVFASVLSIAYLYSVVPSVVIGFMLGPAVRLGLAPIWVGMTLMSVISLFYGGAIVEILRAAINRVSTVVMKRARRGALVLRLVLTVVIILILQVLFNFVLLADLISAFASTLNIGIFLPVFWGSLAVRAAIDGDAVRTVAYSLATLTFAVTMLWVATKVRAKYWSPSPADVIISARDYAPRASPLSRLGLNHLEAALVRKDLTGLFRRREMLQYFSIPFVLGVVFILQSFAAPSTAQTPKFVGQLPVWFVGGLFGMIVSSISFGQEGKSVSLLYSLPVTPKEVLRAKVFTAMLFALVATICTFAVVTLISRPTPLAAIENLAVALAITVQEVCLGLAFGARFPDFQERPRPRFVDPMGIIAMVLVGMCVMFITALPVIVGDVISTIPGIEAPTGSLYLASLAFAVAVTGLAYTWAARETKKMLSEYRW